ncbi:hypothetical protein JMUB7557_27720 [Staphylococcus aureus]
MTFSQKAIHYQLVLVCEFQQVASICLLYTSDAADDGESVDLGGRRIIKKKVK